MGTRQQAVRKLKQFLCSQCLRYPRAAHRYECQRCINTNQRSNMRKGKPLSDEQKLKISQAMLKAHANRKARKEAFGKRDTLSNEDIQRDATEMINSPGRKKYTRKIPVNPVQMAGMVNDLESFISGIDNMTARQYLEERRQLIVGIILRGGK